MQPPPDDGDSAGVPATGSMPMVHESHAVDASGIVTSLVTIPEDVRAHLADMLHDGPVQALTAVMMGLGLARLDATGDIKAELETLEGELATALGTLRREMNLLRSSSASSGRFRDVILAALAEHAAESCFVVDVVGDEPPTAVQGCIRRIVREIASALPKRTADSGFDRVGSIQMWSIDGATAIRVTTSGIAAMLDSSLREEIAQLDGVARSWEGSGRWIVRVTIPHPRGG